jgi:hypothetical protein
MNQAQQFPKYQCHKTVSAVKIVAVERDGEGAIITPYGEYAPFRVPISFVVKHSPHAGGYFVQYADGYQSFSPAEAFESGYTEEKQLPATGAVVAKMRCNVIETAQYGQHECQTYRKVKLGAVYGTAGENADFSKATPSGECWMQIDAGVPASRFFEPQADYYVHFTRAPK